MHRHCDLLGAWDAVLMTTGEARMFCRLLFADEDGATLIELYRDLFDELLELDADGGRVSAELSVALSRLAANVDAVIRLGNEHRRMAWRIEEGKGAFQPTVEDWHEVYAEIAEIFLRPSICMQTLEDRQRFLLVKSALIRKVSPLATFAGYDEAQFASAIAKAQLKVRAEA